MEHFIRTRFHGSRFNGGKIPLRTVGVLEAWDDIIIQCARHCYFVENPTRKHVPNGFMHQVSLDMIALEEGSATAVLAMALRGNPANHLYVFNGFGLLVGGLNRLHRLPDSVIRHLFMLLSPIDYAERIDITVLDYPTVSLTSAMVDDILEPIESDLPAVARLNDVALMSRAYTGRTDVPSRLNELRSMRDGWLTDEPSIAPSHEGLDWFSNAFTRIYPPDLPLPYIFPTPQGGIEAEWDIANKHAAFAVDIDAHWGKWLQWDINTDYLGSKDLNLNSEADWLYFITQIREMASA